MARSKGTANLSANLEVKAGAPLDARSVIPAKADLTASDTFPYKYIGMEVYVVAEGKKYRLIANDTTNIENWQLLSEEAVTIDSELSSVSENPVQNKVIKGALDDKVDVVEGKGLSTNDYTTAEKEKLAGIDLTNYIPTSQKGANSGVAELDANGKVPSSQLPSYVDDVEEYSSVSQFPVTGETGKVYVDTSTNITYRWGGSEYVKIGSDLALGETSSTAYRGDRGKVAYDDSQANKTNIGTLANLTTTDKSSLVSAINELKQTGGGTIDSTPTSGSTNAVQSGGVYTALQGKVDTVSGKGLSTNDYDNTEKSKVANAQSQTLTTPITVEGVEKTTVEDALNAINDKPGITVDSELDTESDNAIANGPVATALNEKVDKVTGKGLSTEDYTTAEKTKLASLQNYDDTEISGRVEDIEDIIPSDASTSNKLATMADVQSGGTTNYNDLNNKPQIAGVTLSGNKSLSDLGVQEALTFDNTPTENSDNPVTSDGIYTALEGKVDAETGKGLSTNDYTTAEKNKLAGLQNYDDTALSGRVSDIENVVPDTATTSNKLATMEDVQSGGTTDYTDLNNKPQIAGVTLSGNRTLSDLGIQGELTFDNTPTENSTNPVKSGGVYSALAGKVNTESGKGLSSNDYTTAEKTKLAGLSNYDDTEIQSKVSDIEDVIPSSASTSNKLATMNDIPSGSSGHTIEKADGTDMTARSNLQFVGATVTDDSTNDRTVVTITGGTTDATPTQGSTNPVQSGGVYTALQGKANGEGMTFTLDERNVLNVATESDTPPHYALPAGGTTGQVLAKASDDDDDVEWVDSDYTLPPASDTTLGGVKVGSGLSIDQNGYLSTSGGAGGGHIINDNGTPMAQRGEMNFIDFDLTDDDTNEQTVVEPHEITSEEWADIIGSLPGTPTDLPVLFDERGTEYQVGWYVNSSGLKKPVYEKTIYANISSTGENTLFNISTYSMETVFFNKVYINMTQGYKVICPYKNNDNDMWRPFITPDGDFKVTAGAYGVGSGYFTLQYTKTTDTPQ